MKYRRPGLAVLAAGVLVLAASPAFALMASCTAQDSDSRWYVSKQPGVFDWQARNFAESVAMADCQGRSKHPESCKIVGCQISQ